MTKKPFPWRNFWLHAGWYAFDMVMAIAAWCIGFGLTVQNWPALIGIGMGSRFVFHVLNHAVMYRRAKLEVQAELEGKPHG